MSDGEHVFNYIFRELRDEDQCVIPAITIGADDRTKRAVKNVERWNHNGVAIVITPEELANQDISYRIRSTVKMIYSRKLVR